MIDESEPINTMTYSIFTFIIQLINIRLPFLCGILWCSCFSFMPVCEQRIHWHDWRKRDIAEQKKEQIGLKIISR